MRFKKLRLLTYILILIISITSIDITAYATQEELNNEAEERKKDTVESNEREAWPQGPRIGADGAVLMDAETGAILYAKNMDKKLFPASTTKIMTSLVAVENSNLDDKIKVSQSAIDANASDGSNMGLRTGEVLTAEEILYGILINSANEGCNAMAEHVAGSMDAYVELMNKRARELGCTNTHFVTTNGLHDENHYTTAHDLALIARAFFSHDVLCKMSSTTRYVIPETSEHVEHVMNTHNKLLPGQDYAYEYLVGSKTGFTSNSRQTLVTCAEKDGVKLICVIMKEESPNQFTDTLALFDYGFSNFEKLNIYDNDTKYTNADAPFFDSEEGSHGSTKPILTIDKNSSILVPAGTELEDLDTKIKFSLNANDSLASIEYYYGDTYLGAADVVFTKEGIVSISENNVAPEVPTESKSDNKNKSKSVIVDIRKVIATILIAAVSCVVLLVIFGYVRKFYLNGRKIRKIKKNRNSKPTRRRMPARRSLGASKIRRTPKQTGFVKRGKRRIYKAPSRSTLYNGMEKKNNKKDTFKTRHDIDFKNFDF